jgi:hypothetical protein
MDYSIFALESSLEDSKLVNNAILEQMDRELTFMMNCLESTVINLGELQIVQETFADTVRNIIQAIINFFKRLFGDYRAASEKKVSEFNKWHTENKHKLDNIDHGSMAVEIHPFWQGAESLTKGMAIVDNIREGHMNQFLPITKGMKELNLKNLADEDTFLKSDSKIQPLVNKDGNVTEGSKNYFMFGKADDVPPAQKLTGAEIVEKAKIMVTYCSTYDTNVVKRLDDVATRTDNSIAKIQSQLKITDPATSAKATTEPVKPADAANNQKVAASALLLNDLGELKNCLNYETVYEADVVPMNKPTTNQPNKNQTQATQTAENKPADTAKADDKAGDKTKVQKGKVIDITNKDEVADNTEDNRLSQYNHQQLQALKVLYGVFKKVISAAMSAQERVFVEYFGILKSVADKEIKEPTKKEEEGAKPAETKKEAKGFS